MNSLVTSVLCTVYSVLSFLSSVLHFNPQLWHFSLQSEVNFPESAFVYSLSRYSLVMPVLMFSHGRAASLSNSLVAKSAASIPEVSIAFFHFSKSKDSVQASSLQPQDQASSIRPERLSSPLARAASSIDISSLWPLYLTPLRRKAFLR